MEEQNRKKLENAISELPSKEAPDIWANIEAKIQTDEEHDHVLSEAISQMPSKQAPDIWLPIEASLPSQKRSRSSVWMVAASAALFIASLFLFIESRKVNEQSTISYSTEKIETMNVSLEIDDYISSEDAILDYIQKNCKKLALTCNDPEFKGLMETYVELSEAKEELANKLEQKGQQPQLMKYLIRIEKNQTRVGKDLLKKMRKS